MISKVFEAVYLPENVTARVLVVWGEHVLSLKTTLLFSVERLYHIVHSSTRHPGWRDGKEALVKAPYCPLG